MYHLRLLQICYFRLHENINIDRVKHNVKNYIKLIFRICLLNPYHNIFDIGYLSVWYLSRLYRWEISRQFCISCKIYASLHNGGKIIMSHWYFLYGRMLDWKRNKILLLSVIFHKTCTILINNEEILIRQQNYVISKITLYS